MDFIEFVKHYADDLRRGYKYAQICSQQPLDEAMEVWIADEFYAYQTNPETFEVSYCGH